VTSRICRSLVGDICCSKINTLSRSREIDVPCPKSTSSKTQYTHKTLSVNMGRYELEYPKDATNTMKRHNERGQLTWREIKIHH
jgi:hypothetical protein